MPRKEKTTMEDLLELCKNTNRKEESLQEEIQKLNKEHGPYTSTFFRVLS